jgi:hypothetical protein
MDNLANGNALFETILRKAILKQDIYDTTKGSFTMFKNAIVEVIDGFRQKLPDDERRIAFEYHDRGEFEFELKFAGDILIFMMHTNIFEFPRNHEIMRTPYIKDDFERSYCGVINIYNFLADSFKYNRENDYGYMIGRVFINKERHYLVEGKKELNMLYNSFENRVLSEADAKQIVESAILYTSNFDLLTPPYDEVKQVTVYEMQYNLDNMRLKTGKRLGFRFQADEKNFMI